MNPVSIICDSIPQFNREILQDLLKQRTGNLNHENYLNASICDYRDMTVLCYRTEQEPYCTNPRIHVVQVDDRFIPQSESYTLATRASKQGWRVDYTGKCNAGYQGRAEDPRLVVVDGILYVFWTDGFKMYYGTLELAVQDGKLSGAKITNQWIPKPPFVPEIAMDSKYDGREKNWVPFSWNDELWVIYSNQPFICCRLEGSKITKTIRHEVNLGQYRYGFIKGGSQAIPLDDDRHVTFFHSTIKMPKGDGSRNEVNYYYMGALTFCRKTLKPLEISRYPLVAPYPDGDKRRNNDMYVVFPCGVVNRNGTFVVSYGYNDHSIKLFASTAEQLEYNLTTIDSEAAANLLKKKPQYDIYEEVPDNRDIGIRREPRSRLFVRGD